MPVTLDFSKAQPIPQGGVTLDFSKAKPIAAQDAPQEGFFRSLGDTLGIPNGPTPTVKQALTQGVKNAVIGPVGTVASSLYQQGKQSFDQARQAYEAAKQGNTAGVIQHAVTAVPIVGPALDKASDQYADKNYMGEAGTLTGASAQVAPMVLGAADAALPRRPIVPNPSLPNLMDKFPTRAKAGEIFNQLNSKLADQPVPLASASAPLQRAIEIAARGGTMPTPVKALLERSQAIEPMTFPEARDYQASLSDLSASDKLAMNGRMKGAVAQLNQALYQDLRQAAESGGGMGADYDKAMTDYRRASVMRDAVKATGKAALQYAPHAAAAAAGYSLYSDLKK